MFGYFFTLRSFCVLWSNITIVIPHRNGLIYLSLHFLSLSIVTSANITQPGVR
jgi:hypothetical protein